jgi:hypothetical protein
MPRLSYNLKFVDGVMGEVVAEPGRRSSQSNSLPFSRLGLGRCVVKFVAFRGSKAAGGAGSVRSELEYTFAFLQKVKQRLGGW